MNKALRLVSVMSSIDPELAEIPPYLILFIAFTVWMLIDAYKRRAPLGWVLIIFLCSPVGALAYFFAVKFRDFRAATPTSKDSASTSWFPLRSKSPSLEEADQWEREDDYARAEPVYRKALLDDPNDKRALHGLGRCLHGMGRSDQALEHFERLLELDREYANFSAALDYADALFAANRHEDSLELLDTLANFSQRINHRLALAHYLAEAGQAERARTETERALQDFERLPVHQKDKHEVWASRARAMLERWSGS